MCIAWGWPSSNPFVLSDTVATLPLSSSDASPRPSTLLVGTGLRVAGTCSPAVSVCLSSSEPPATRTTAAATPPTSSASAATIGHRRLGRCGGRGGPPVGPLRPPPPPAPGGGALGGWGDGGAGACGACACGACGGGGTVMAAWSATGCGRDAGGLRDEDLVLCRHARGFGRGCRARHLERVRQRPGAHHAARAIDRGGQLRRPRVARVRVLGGRSRNHLVEGLGVGALEAGRRRRVGDVRPQLGHVVVLREGNAAGEHLVEHAAERVDVGPPVDRPGLDLLGRDVVRGPDPGAGAGQAAGRPEPLGEPEVGQVDVLVLALAADQDVGRLDVAVHEPAVVSGVECAGDRGDHTPDLIHAELAAIDDLAQVRARHEAHREVEHAVVLAAAVDRDDVGVLQRGREPGLGLEAGDRVRVLGVLGRDDLQRHGAVQLRVGGLVDHAHAAAIEHALDAVAGKLGARLESGQAVDGFIHARSPPNPCYVRRGGRYKAYVTKLTAEPSAGKRLTAPGGTPITRLNARAKAASER